MRGERRAALPPPGEPGGTRAANIMDEVTQAKEFLLEVWEKAAEAERKDRARQGEEAERKQRKEQECRQREQEQQRAKEQEAAEAERQQQERATPPGEPPGSEGSPQEEEAQAGQQQAKEQEAQANEGGDPIAATLKAITAQLAEMEQSHREAREAARKQEQARAETRKLLLAGLDELEKVLRAMRANLDGIIEGAL